MTQKKTYVGLKPIIENVIDYTLGAMFPDHYGDGKHNQQQLLQIAKDNLIDAIKYTDKADEAEEITNTVIAKWHNILGLIETDIEAAYQGDPAALNTDEIILAYPAFKAIAVYRIAHEIYNQKVPIIPRIMMERIHTITGIDIHPGAKIGTHFFIDHGTGVVIGQTTTIGNHVKIYQHVTLGALSFKTHDDGALVKGEKRHPDIGNNVVIYAGATILGGDTHIGDNAVIGGGTWVVKSVEAGKTIVQKPF